MAFCDKQNRLQTPFIPNSKLVFTIPLGGKILEGKVVLTGGVTITGAGDGTLGEGGPINLIKRLIVNANPAANSRYAGGRIVDCSPRSIMRYAVAQHSGKFISEQSGSTLGSGAAAPYTIYMSYPIYWADSTLRNNVSTALNTDPGTYASVQVEVDTADITYCFAGGPVATYPALTVQWVDDRVGLQGDTNVLFQEDHMLLIAAAQKRMLDPGLPRDGAYLFWGIWGEQSATQALSDALLNKVHVFGNPIEYEKYAEDIRQKMLDDEWVDPANTNTGMYMIDWTDSALGNTIMADTLQNWYDVNNPSGSNLDDLLIYTRRIFAPAPSS